MHCSCLVSHCSSLFQVAEVTIKGKINGISFCICRTKTTSKGSLIFWLNGTDLTTHSIRETQELINERMSISSQLLTRTMFHGQHAMNELLAATDTKLKEELSLLASIEIWQSAVKYTREQARLAAKRTSELEGMLLLRISDIARLKHRLEAMETELIQKEMASRETIKGLQTEIECIALNAATPLCTFNLTELETDLDQTEKQIAALQDTIRTFSGQHKIEVAHFKTLSDDCAQELQCAKAATLLLDQAKGEQNVNVALARSKVRSMEELWKFDTSTQDWLDTFAFPIKCPTCHQPISSSQNSSAIIQDIKEARNELVDAERKFEDIGDDLKLLNKAMERAQIKAEDAQKAVDEKCRYHDDYMHKLRERHCIVLESQRKASSAVAAAAKQIQGESRRELLLNKIKTEQDSLNDAKTAVGSLQCEAAEFDLIVHQLNSERMKLLHRIKLMNELSLAFGQRGIQAFIFRNVVSMLQSVTQSYLDKLSDGTQIMDLNLDSADRVQKCTYVRLSNNQFKERPLAALSGGQWRRCSIALSLGFADLACRMGKISPSLCVWDEPLTHLDRTGRSEVGRVLRSLIQRTFETEHTSTAGFKVSTLILVLQDIAAEELDESFDSIDEVVKRSGQSVVLVDGETS